MNKKTNENIKEIIFIRVINCVTNMIWRYKKMFTYLPDM